MLIAVTTPLVRVALAWAVSAIWRAASERVTRGVWVQNTVAPLLGKVRPPVTELLVKTAAAISAASQLAPVRAEVPV